MSGQTDDRATLQSSTFVAPICATLVLSLMPDSELAAAVTPTHPVTPPRRVPKPKTAADRKARLRKILTELDNLFPRATCALHHGNAWQLLVATILSAQCTDERVNKVTPDLFKKYPRMEDFANAPREELSQDIRSTGFFNNKSRSLIGAAKKILADYHGEVPRTMDELLSVPGAARKTANVVLGTAYGIPSGVVVDTHVQRISLRLDLTKNTDPIKIEQDLLKILPEDRWILFSHQVIHFGRQICIARKPRCANCPLDPICYAKDKTLA
jgi:endonuclease III